MTLKRWDVSELTRYVRLLVEQDYRLQDLEVEGEVSNWRAPGSGHAYFTLKDSGAQLRCVMWRSDVQVQSSLPHDGDRVVARGHVGLYEAGGQYQLYCRSLRPAGAGDLAAQLEELKRRLEAEGLFDPARKRPIPERPTVIGVVTSPGAAALQDVITVLGRRNPLARLILSPAAVQGAEAPPQIIAALAALNDRPDIDVILMIRGGGSLEDLWCFNDEMLARAVAASRVPVVSGVGHEIDFTLADFAADVRAPTPSAAAELVSPITLADRAAGVLEMQNQLEGLVGAALESKRQAVGEMATAVRHLSPQFRIDNARQRIDGWLERLARAGQGDLNLRRARLDGRVRALAAMSPRATLDRGYAVVRMSDGRAIRRADETRPGERLDIRLSAGRLDATVESVHETSKD